jgi:hypothetical protein
MFSAKQGDDKMVVTLNKKEKIEQPPSLAATAQILFGNPTPQYLNAITIATN